MGWVVCICENIFLTQIFKFFSLTCFDMLMTLNYKLSSLSHCRCLTKKNNQLVLSNCTFYGKPLNPAESYLKNTIKNKFYIQLHQKHSFLDANCVNKYLLYGTYMDHFPSLIPSAFSQSSFLWCYTAAVLVTINSALVKL